jgi:hypothetical protein
MAPPASIPPAAGDERLSPRLFWILGLAVVALAWMLREQFILVGRVDMPSRGDIVQYVSYAWNLVHHGEFSSADPGPLPPAADAFRGPGYPLFLAAFLASAPDDASWYT